jgi:hypothetical protein
MSGDRVAKSLDVRKGFIEIFSAHLQNEVVPCLVKKNN